MTKQFGGLLANDRMSLTVRAGEVVALIGPNGAGKSTLFDCLSAVSPPTSGSIRFRGEPTESLAARELARRGMGRTFQHVRLLGQMSVLENVAIGAHARGRRGVVAAALRLDRAEERRLLAEAAHQLERVGLSEHLVDDAGSLPLGQQRLVEIARALASDPWLLLLDEPAAGLRYLEKRVLAELLRKLRAEGMGILLVEHDMEFVMGLADRVVVMDFGATIAEGLPEDGAARSEGPRGLPGRSGGGVRPSAPEPGDGASVLEVRDLRVSYGQVEALHGVSLAVRRGEIATVIGPNGAGKTTLLSALMGLLPADGEIRYLGQRQGRRREVEALVRSGMTLVPERRELFAGMSVEDNLLLGAYDRRRAGHRDQAETMAEVFERFPRLLERRRQLAGTLSGGERQMLAMGRALMARPRLLLLDEPSLGLAPLIIGEVFRIIGELKRTGVAILLVEQNARAALQVADYGYVLELGEVSLSGPSGELAADPRVIEAYLGLGRSDHP